MKNLLYLLFFVIPVLSWGQQVPWPSTFSSANYGWNPAMTAPMAHFEAQTIYKQQWLGFDNAPRTLLVGFQYPFVGLRMGVGVQLMQDRTGPIRNTQASAMYAYKIRVGFNGRLAFGLNTTYSQFGFDGTDLVARDEDDLLLGDAEAQKGKVNFGFGVYYQSVGEKDYDEPYLFAGLSAMQLLPSQLVFSEISSLADFRRVIHGQALIGYHFNSGGSVLEPSLQIMYSAENITHYQLDLKFEYERMIWAGLYIDSEFRTGVSLGVNSELTHGELVLGILGSYNISTVGSEQGLSYQLLAAYRFYL